MKTAMECIPCFIRQAMEAVEMCDISPMERERLLRRLLRDVAETSWSVIPVSVSQQMHRIIRKETGQPDPYRPLKDRMNRLALDLVPDLSNRAKRHENPREAIVRLAIAGNLLDAGAKTRIDPEELSEHLDAIWHTPLSGSVDDFFKAADNAEKILYLADNAGEIVFDRMLIEALPTEKITLAVRGVPIINDATMEDAQAAGLRGLVPVITNGSDAPGTIIEECSDEFRSAFDNADMIISKGQGNYETLSETTKNVFFLLTVKCPVIASDIDAPLRSLVVKKGKNVR